MPYKYPNPSGLRRFVGLIVLFLWLGTDTHSAAGESHALTIVRTLYTSEWRVPHPVGIAYISDDAHLLLLNKNPSQWQSPISTSIVVITPYEEYVGTVPLTFVAADAIIMAFDNSLRRLFLLSRDQEQLIQLKVDAYGLPNPATLLRYNIAEWELTDAQGMAVDSSGRKLFILNSSMPALLRYNITVPSRLDAIEPALLPLSHLKAADLRGLGFHPANGHLYVMSSANQLLYELSDTGQLLAEHDLRDLGLCDPQGLAFAPSSDLTDAASIVHLFIADSNLTNCAQPIVSEAPTSSSEQSCRDAVRHRNNNVAHRGDTYGAAQADRLRFGKIVEVELVQPEE